MNTATDLDRQSDQPNPPLLRLLRYGYELRSQFIIAHCLSTVRHADRIFVLTNGTVSEQGTHDELITKPQGTYANLWRVQTGEAVKHHNH